MPNPPLKRRGTTVSARPLSIAVLEYDPPPRGADKPRHLEKSAFVTSEAQTQDFFSSLPPKRFPPPFRGFSLGKALGTGHLALGKNTLTRVIFSFPSAKCPVPFFSSHSTSRMSISPPQWTSNWQAVCTANLAISTGSGSAS